MDNKELQTLTRVGVSDTGKVLDEVQSSVEKIFETVTEYINMLSENESFVGEAANIFFERYENFKKEFPHILKEIRNYSEFMTNTLTSYEETDQRIEKQVVETLNKEIEKLESAGNIGANS